ncbi:hypothetical protein J6590_007373, partial [Homalodisca vitripennis]
YREDRQAAIQTLQASQVIGFANAQPINLLGQFTHAQETLIVVRYHLYLSLLALHLINTSSHYSQFRPVTTIRKVVDKSEAYARRPRSDKRRECTINIRSCYNCSYFPANCSV